MALLKAREFILKTGETGVVRSALERDAEPILRHIRANLREGVGFVTTPAEFTLTVPQEREFIREHLDHPGWLSLVAEVEGEIVGFLNFETESRRRIAHSGDIGMGVQKPWRGRGIGEALLAALVRWAEKNARVERVSLKVFANNAPAISLYEKLGFVKEGRCVRAIKLGRNNYLDEFLMSRWVK